MSSLTLFSNKLPVLKVREDDRRKTELLFTIEIVHNIKKEMMIRLTDENDQFFLFQLRINEEDFQILKSQQGLLIDFGAFPQKVIDMLGGCVEKNSRESNKFNLIFTITGGGGLSSTGHLSIVETNEFKHLNHLVLDFHPGTDNDIKNYLLDNLKVSKDKLEQTRLKLDQVEFNLGTQLRQCKETLAAKSKEATDTKNNTEQKLSDLQSKHNQDVHELQHKHSTEKKEMEQKQSHTMKRLESKVTELNSTVQNLTEVKSRNESQLEELKSRLSTSDEEVHRLRSEIAASKREISSIGGKLMELEHKWVDTSTRLAVAEQQVKDKGDVVDKVMDQLKTEKHLTKKSEEDLEMRKKELVTTTMCADELKAEVEKGIEIIKKFKADNKRLNAKMKLRNQISIEQERRIIESHKEKEEQTRKLDVLENEFFTKEEDLKKVQKENVDLKNEIEESKNILRDNEIAISYLRQQSIENQIVQLKTFETSQTMKQLPSSNFNHNIGVLSSAFRDQRINSNNSCNTNNPRPIACEDYIDQKHLRSSTKDPLVQPIHQLPPRPNLTTSQPRLNNQLQQPIHTATGIIKSNLYGIPTNRNIPGSNNINTATTTNQQFCSTTNNLTGPAPLLNKDFGGPASHHRVISSQKDGANKLTPPLASAYFPSRPT